MPPFLLLSRRCLNDPHVFLVMSGLYFGLSHWFRLHVCHESLVTFPPVQLHGSTQIRLRFGAIAVRAFKACARDLRWFYLFYFAYGEEIERKDTKIEHSLTLSDFLLNPSSRWADLVLFI